MPVIVAELFEGFTLTRGQNPSASVPYLVYGTNDPQEAQDQLISQSPATFDGLTKTDATVEPLTFDAWRGTVRYGTIPEEGATIISFDTTGGTAHVTQSLETVAKIAAGGGTAPDFHGAIGVTKDSVEGVDIPAPALSFSIQKSMQASAITFSYVNFLKSMTGCVNNAVWNNFAKGEVMFMGAQAQGSVTDKLIPVTFNFNASENATNIQIAPDLIIPEKEGWHYVWLRYADDEDGTAGQIVKRPTAAYVERVVRYGDFSMLGV